MTEPEEGLVPDGTSHPAVPLDSPAITPDEPDGCADTPPLRREPPEWLAEFLELPNRKRIYRLARLLGAKTLDEAIDVGDFALVQVAKTAHTIESNPMGWARTAMKRHMVREREKLKRRRLLELQAVDHSITCDVHIDLEPILIEDEEWVMEKLKSLPPLQSEAMTLLYDGLTGKEIADRLEVELTTITSRLAAARKILLKDAEIARLHRAQKRREQQLAKSRALLEQRVSTAIKPSQPISPPSRKE